MTELMPEDHTDPGWMIDQELADTLEAARTKHARKYAQAKRRRAHKPPLQYDLRAELDKPARDYLDHIDGHS